MDQLLPVKNCILLLAFVVSGVQSVSCQNIDNNVGGMRVKLDSLKKRMATFLVQKDADAIMEFYDAELTYYPEYKPAIFSTASLNQFFKDWFKQVDIRSYRKEIYKVESFSHCILEIGTFQMTYASNGANQTYDYNGKYMVVWKWANKEHLAILSEAFSADKYIEPDAVPYSKVSVIETSVVPNYEALDKPLLAEIDKQNVDVISAVVRGDGNDRARGFVDDGIYMPHFDKILAGMSNIRPYMLKTYYPEAKYRVKHNFYRIFEFGDVVLISGHFDGGWGNEKDGGVFTGNMLSLLRREHGTLLMYCQLTNNDKKILSFKQ